MKILPTSLLLITFIVHGSWASKEHVIEYTDDNFKSGIADYELALVMFYAPWCGHCKKLKPDYEKAASEISLDASLSKAIALAKVDCTGNGKETCNSHEISGYPTLKIFRNGAYTKDYSGPRDAKGIVKSVRTEIEPSSKQLDTVEAFTTYMANQKEVTIVGFFGGGTKLMDTFQRVADSTREKYQFAYTQSPEVFKHEQHDDVDADYIVLYRPIQLRSKFEPATVKYDGGNNEDDIKKFIQSNYNGILGYRTPENQHNFVEPIVNAYYAIDYDRNMKQTNYWRNRLMKVAAKYTDQYTFSMANKYEFQHELNEYGVDYANSDAPIITARDVKKRKYSMKENFTMENFEQFVKDLHNNKLVPYLKSEPIPTDNDDKSVKTAVANNFDDVVINNDMDTLIEFYAPWCGHCKKLEPIYDKVGAEMKNEQVAIVKMDATANDVPFYFQVTGFPTIFWLPKDSKGNPKLYEGGREVDDFIKYIAKHATNELAGYDRNGKKKSDKTEL